MEPLKIDNLKIYKPNNNLELIKKIGLSILAFGFLMLFVSLTGVSSSAPFLFLFLSFGLIIIGALIYIIPTYNEAPPGIRNNKIFFNSFTSRGSIALFIGVIITGFYILLYWFPNFFENWIRLLDPISYNLRGIKADQWFLYGTFYTIAVIVMGVKMLIKYRHNR